MRMEFEMKISFINYLSKKTFFRGHTIYDYLLSKGYDLVVEQISDADCYWVFAPFTYELIQQVRKLRKQNKTIIYDNYYSYVEAGLEEGYFKKKSLKERTLRISERILFDIADFILVDTESSRKFYIDIYHIPPEKIFAIYVVCDTKKFFPRPRNEELIKKLDLHEPILMYHGGFLNTHRADIIIEAFLKILPKYSSATLLMLGKGYNQQRCKGIANNSPNIKFYDGVPYDQLPEYLSIATIWLGMFGDTPKSNRTARTAMFETMAEGITIITGKSLESTYFVKDGTNGHLVPLEDSDSLAGKIIDVLEKKLFTGDAARKSVAGIFDLETIGKQVEEILQKTPNRKNIKIITLKLKILGFLIKIKSLLGHGSVRNTQ